MSASPPPPPPPPPSASVRQHRFIQKSGISRRFRSDRRTTAAAPQKSQWRWRTGGGRERGREGQSAKQIGRADGRTDSLLYRRRHCEIDISRSIRARSGGGGGEYRRKSDSCERAASERARASNPTQISGLPNSSGMLAQIRGRVFRACPSLGWFVFSRGFEHLDGLKKGKVLERRRRC